jgi:hypothetical protein
LEKKRRVRWAGHIAGMGKKECIQDIGGNARRKTLLGRPRCRWVDNVKMNLRHIVWGCMDCIDLAKDRD